MKTHHHYPPAEPGHNAKEHDLPSQVRRFAETHQPAIIGGAVTLLLILTVLFLIQRRDQREILASEALGQARVTEDFEEISERFSRTSSAPLAMLQAARQHYETGAIQRALDMYDRFLRVHSDHHLAESAVLGRLHCHEAMGRLDEALRGYDEFMNAHPVHPLRPQAVFGKARCLQALGRGDEARIVYEDFIALNPESRWLPQAEEMLRDLQRRSRLAAQGTDGE